MNCACYQETPTGVDKMNTETPYWQQAALPRYAGFVDPDGHYVPFEMADEVFARARKLHARVLLRLEINEDGKLEGLLYTNAQGIGALS